MLTECVEKSHIAVSPHRRQCVSPGVERAMLVYPYRDFKIPFTDYATEGVPVWENYFRTFDTEDHNLLSPVFGEHYELPQW